MGMCIFMEHKKEVYNCETGELTFELLSESEVAERITEQQKIELEILEIEEKIRKRALILAKLGISEEEAKLLF